MSLITQRFQPTKRTPSQSRARTRRKPQTSNGGQATTNLALTTRAAVGYCHETTS